MTLPSTPDFRGWIPGVQIGSGRAGYVYTCHSQPGPLGAPPGPTVIKIVPFYKSPRSRVPHTGIQTRFALEKRLATWSGESRLGPRVFASWATERFGFIVMERWDMTLAEWKRSSRRRLESSDSSTETCSQSMSQDSQDDWRVVTSEPREACSAVGAVRLGDTREDGVPLSFDEAVRQALDRVVSMAKYAGHMDIKESNIVVKTDPRDPSLIRQLGVIDWDKVRTSTRIARQCIFSM